MSTITLPQGAINILTQCLTSTGWGKGDDAVSVTKRSYLAGKLLASIPDFPEPPICPNQEDMVKSPIVGRTFQHDTETYQEVPGPAFEVDNKTFALCQECLKFHIKADNISKGSSLNALIDAFKLID